MSGREGSRGSSLPGSGFQSGGRGPWGGSVVKYWGRHFGIWHWVQNEELRWQFIFLRVSRIKPNGAYFRVDMGEFYLYSDGTSCSKCDITSWGSWIDWDSQVDMLGNHWCVYREAGKAVPPFGVDGSPSKSTAAMGGAPRHSHTLSISIQPVKEALESFETPERAEAKRWGGLLAPLNSEHLLSFPCISGRIHHPPPKWKKSLHRQTRCFSNPPAKKPISAEWKRSPYPFAGTLPYH